ncbi:RHS repeat-associated core domain-containing protein [Pseudomonas xantholysinigenes]|uniref:RHS repeat-associated core domain-containing protein n=1 Tax=Pseudomonas xantholysinigenes TaxID=2745490 RepID=A0A9E6PXM7_9PSED|nr:RHS repeat-associated core domain-containing protein [Pseudomonas xantholysinigenes]QXI39435.1 hypothetical protein HU772_004960 [Pseudomonas xantholysinigenes]
MSTASLVLGRQTFDGLGRQTSVEVAGRITHYHYRPGQLPPVANTLADGKRIDFTYEPQLDNALLSAAPENGSPEYLHYHPQLARPMKASGALGTLQWQFTPSGAAQADTWTEDGNSHSSQWRTSLGGRLLGFTDSSGSEHQRIYDACGRLEQIVVDRVSTHFAYDALSRLQRETTHDLDTARTLEQQLTYDTMGREASRTLTLTGEGEPRVITQTLEYSALDQVILRSWNDGQEQLEERFAYDVRGRLVQVVTTTGTGPCDPFGNVIVEQHFIFNALDGYRQVTCIFDDGSQDIATYCYAADDPCQVVAINHTHPSWPARIDLRYDSHGRLVADSLGRVLTWDAQERLQRVEYQGRTCEYRYTPDGRLRDRIIDGVLNRSFFSANQLTHEQSGDERLHRVGDENRLYALGKVTEGIRQNTLLGCDGQGSVRLQVGDRLQSLHYGAHGTEQDNDQQQPFGYAGERREPLTGWYMAAGYRPYDPLLMVFLAPDSESPFGRGGINAYAYCAGDPVNRIDPDGHSWQTWLLAGAGIAVGAIATIASLGTASAALSVVLAGSAMTASGMLAVTTAALNTVSLSTGVAAMALQAKGTHENAAHILGWISLGAGAASLLSAAKSLGSGSLAHASKSASRLPGATAVGPISKPTHWVKRSAVLYARSDDVEDVVWHTNLWGKNIRAFETHGSPTGQLMNAQGQAEDPVRIALREIAPRLSDLPGDVPIVLLACHGGKSGAAQKIADTLRRPVYGYDQSIFVKRTAWMQHLWVDDAGTSIPTQQAAKPHALGTLAADRELAAGRLYFPRK